MQSLGKKFPQKMTHLLEVFSTENWHNLNEKKKKIIENELADTCK